MPGPPALALVELVLDSMVPAMAYLPPDIRPIAAVHAAVHAALARDSVSLMRCESESGVKGFTT